MRNMAEIDFGTLVLAVVNEMNCTTSELFGDELTNPDLAVKRYNRNVIGAIRQVFDDAEADDPAPAVQTCTHCGVTLGAEDRFCHGCGMPLTADVIPGWLLDALAKDAGAAADDPRVMQALLAFRGEDPEGWSRMRQKIEKQLEAKVPALA